MGPLIRISPGELAALRSLTLQIPGSVDPAASCASWGPCARHAFLLMVAECARFQRDLRAPAALYSRLLRTAERELHRDPGSDPSDLAARIDDGDRCPVCKSHAAPARDEGLDRAALARGAVEFQRFREETSRHWRRFVCATCGGERRAVRCRRHLACDLRAGARPDVERQRRMVEAIAGHLIRYARSFDWHHRGSETTEDRAALIAAIGWSSGWRLLIGLPERR